MSPSAEPSSFSSDFVVHDADISLRPFTLSDVDYYMNWATDEKVLSFFRTYPLSTKEEALRELKRLAIPHPWYRAICYCGDPIGYVRLDRGRRDERNVGDISYCLSYSYWGKGIATFAIKKAVSTIFKEVEGLDRIQAFVAEENIGSRRVVQKVGFEEVNLLENAGYKDGRYFHVVMYWMSRDEYYYQQKKAIRRRRNLQKKQALVHSDIPISSPPKGS